MAIPDFQSLMLPLLKLTVDQQEHSLSEAIQTLGKQFHLTEQERKHLLPSGKQATFDNRVAWAQSYLKKAVLIESTGKGRFRITVRGSDLLKTPPDKIDMKYLLRFPEYAAFKTASRSKQTLIDPKPLPDANSDNNQTPDEQIKSLVEAINQDLAQTLLEQVKQCAPVFFERLVVDLLLAMGYGGFEGAGEVTKQSGDGGIDGIIREDKLGLDVVCLQAKRWQSIVGRPTVQEFVGSLTGYGASKGVLITTSQFSKEAQEYAQKISHMKVKLINGERLAALMLEHGIGVAIEETYVVKKIDSNYFPES